MNPPVTDRSRIPSMGLANASKERIVISCSTKLDEAVVDSKKWIAKTAVCMTTNWLNWALADYCYKIYGPPDEEVAQSFSQKQCANAVLS